MAQMRGGRTLSGVRVFPEDMDILPSSTASRGTVATIPCDEINPLGTPREYRNSGLNREHITSLSPRSQVLKLLSDMVKGLLNQIKELCILQMISLTLCLLLSNATKN